jgi:hypothetical protein
MKLTKTDAIIQLIYEAFNDKNSVVGYQRCIRSLRVLELSPEDINSVLFHLSYHDERGNQTSWLQKEIAKQAGKKAARKTSLLRKDILREVMR